MIRLKFGSLVTSANNTSYVPNWKLGKIFGCSGNHVRQLYMARFEAARTVNLSYLLFQQRKKAQDGRKNFGIRFLKPHEIKWATCANTLRQQTSLSLADRCRHFRKEFPEAKINPTLLRKLYAISKIKKKKLRWYKSPKKQDPDKFRQMLSTMKQLLTKAKNDGYRLVYLDETMFTRKTLPDAEWALPKENLSVDVALLDEPTLALLCGISKDKGLEHWQIFEQSVNVDKFLEYLTNLRAANGTDKICLFMDNLSSHTSERAKAAMKEHGFRYIYNLPYEPRFNPIELVFSEVKRHFKALRAKKFIGKL